MENVNLIINNLLNDTSFVAWLLGNGDTADVEKWEKWLNDEDYKKQIVAKAKKLHSMPFTEVNIDYSDILGEYEKLRDQLGLLRLKNISQ